MSAGNAGARTGAASSRTHKCGTQVVHVGLVALSLLLLVPLASASLVSPGTNVRTPHAARARRLGASISDLNKTQKRDGASGARFTYYDAGQGACGGTNSASDFIVAIDSSQWDGGSHCYEMITISSGGKSTQAQIVDMCPGCPYGALDLSEGLFSYFADPNQGQIYGDWQLGGSPKRQDPETTSKATYTETIKLHDNLAAKTTKSKASSTTHSETKTKIKTKTATSSSSTTEAQSSSVVSTTTESGSSASASASVVSLLAAIQNTEATMTGSNSTSVKTTATTAAGESASAAGSTNTAPSSILEPGFYINPASGSPPGSHTTATQGAASTSIRGLEAQSSSASGLRIISWVFISIGLIVSIIL